VILKNKVKVRFDEKKERRIIMIAFYSFIAMIIALIAYITNVLPLGVVLIFSAISFLYCLITLVNKNKKLTTAGQTYMVISFLVIIYCIAILFFNIDLNVIMFQ
jgi:Mn2+/Fe2+ NRAMP family transporter